MFNDYRQIIAGMKSHPWLITEESLSVIVGIVNKRLSGEAFTDEEIKIRLEEADKEERANPRVQVGGGVGVLSLYGPMFPKANLMTKLSGATSLEDFSNDLTSLVENDAVKQIVLEIDSPGGSAFMVSETGTTIRKAREKKPIYAIANPVAASGALWLASQATKFYVTESGKVGSLGVYTVHEDISAADEKLGRKVTYISAGEYKTAGNEHEPLTEKTRAYMQELIDDTMVSFIDAVAEGRGLSREKVETDFANGKLYNPKAAKEIGMVDDVMSLDALLGNLVSDNAEPQRTALSQAVHNVHQHNHHLSNEAFSEPGDIRDHPELNEDDAAEGGWRRDTPPAGEDGSVPNRSDTVTNPNQVKGGEEMNEEQLLELRKLLGIADDASVEMILAATKEFSEELEPLRELRQKVEAKKKFAEEYPEEAQRLEKLETRDREHFAKTFSDDFAAARIKRHIKVEGSEEAQEEPTTLGFSALVVDRIETMAKEFSEGIPTIEGFRGVLDAVLSNGIVDYGNKGSEREPESETDDDVIPAAGSKDARELFMSKVESIVEKDKLDFETALVEATKRHPKLAEAYRQPPVVAS